MRKLLVVLLNIIWDKLLSGFLSLKKAKFRLRVNFSFRMMKRTDRRIGFCDSIQAENRGISRFSIASYDKASKSWPQFFETPPSSPMAFIYFFRSLDTDSNTFSTNLVHFLSGTNVLRINPIKSTAELLRFSFACRLRQSSVMKDKIEETWNEFTICFY